MWLIWGSHMVFHALTFGESQGCCLNTRLIGQVFKHLPRVPASGNAMKQTCVIVILTYFTLFNPCCTENAAKTLHCLFSYTGFLLTKWRWLCTFERHNIVTMSKHYATFSRTNISKMISLVRNAFGI